MAGGDGLPDGGTPQGPQGPTWARSGGRAVPTGGLSRPRGLETALRLSRTPGGWAPSPSLGPRPESSQAA